MLKLTLYGLAGLSPVNRGSVMVFTMILKLELMAYHRLSEFDKNIRMILM